ncbi:MAG: group III truncated hemoglobin [Litoreibacter sp.]|uniref:group III truncated hemoglobin n=1 Tax=Litoreibacter sp. TaxID=1969459 RepID=UPI003298C824
MTTLPPRFDITADQIDQVVTKFYAKVRADLVLGPIFASHVPNDGWPAHEAKIASFWRNAILYERGYDGNPMQKHMAAGNVHGEHFAHWLSIFDTVLVAELPHDTARAFSALAHRIARGLRMGVEDMRAPAGAPPTL